MAAVRFSKDALVGIPKSASNGRTDGEPEREHNDRGDEEVEHDGDHKAEIPH